MIMGFIQMLSLVFWGVFMSIPGGICRELEFFSGELFLPARPTSPTGSGSSTWSPTPVLFPSPWSPSNDPVTALQNAIESGNLLEVKRIVSCCPRAMNTQFLFSLSAPGGTALHLAVVKHGMPILNALLEGGASIEIRNSDGNTPLQLAAAIGNLLAVKALIEAGADINSRGSQNLHPLAQASFYRQFAVVEFLLGEGADPDTLSRLGFSALAAAAYEDSVAIAKQLLEAGANVNLRGFRGGTALHSAAYYGAASLMVFLVENGADVSIRDQKGNLAGALGCDCMSEVPMQCLLGRCLFGSEAVEDVWSEIILTRSETSSSSTTLSSPSSSLSPSEKLEKTLKRFEKKKKGKKKGFASSVRGR